jgi:protoheme IX farnesyltransferase
MTKTKNIQLSLRDLVINKVKDYYMLFKIGLSNLVVFSAVIGYFVGSSHWDLLSVFVIALSGYMITGASNAINQIIEKDIDRLMDRTSNRPLPTERMQMLEAILVTGLVAVGGLVLITLYFNSTAGLLSAISLISYAFIYTPLKRINTIAVFVGAIPGALPPIIGYVAANHGQINQFAILIFMIQFIWQFPHFWAIAWVKFEDYKKAGIMLLPSKEGKNQYSALMNVIYVIALIFAGFLPYVFGYVGIKGTIVLTIRGLFFLAPAVRLYLTQEDKDAKKLMFASFFYLPISLFVVLFDKI